MRNEVMRRLQIAAVMAALGVLAAPVVLRSQAAAPDKSLFKHVAHVGWVVKDLDTVVSYWEKLGVRNVRREGVLDLPDVNWRGHNTPTKLKRASVNIGDVTIQWIQPASTGNAYTEFLTTHRGDGVHHLAYEMPSETAFREQIAAFRAKGVSAVQQGSWKAAKGQGLFAYLDTAERGGGLTLELSFNPDLQSGTGTQQAAAASQEYPFTKITQYAFVVRDVKKVSDFYDSIGLGPLPFDKMVSIDRMYRGRAVPFEMLLGWGRNGDVPFEWIQSTAGPNVYDDYLAAHGEGFHHIALNVRDMDEAIDLMTRRGGSVTQSGGWDFPNSKGRFAYIDTERIGGVSTELLWNRPQSAAH